MKKRFPWIFIAYDLIYCSLRLTYRTLRISDSSSKSGRGRIANNQLIVCFETLKGQVSTGFLSFLFELSSRSGKGEENGIRTNPKQVPYTLVQTRSEDAVDVQEQSISRFRADLFPQKVQDDTEF